jgi:predicted phosphate transport protein (TIGR00153 family)
MFRLIPREESFFDLFEAASKNVHETALELRALFADWDQAPAHAARIKELEHNGDKLTHDTMTRLNKTFITPLDREDIHTLITRLDDVTDLIDAAVTRMMLYRVPGPTEDAKKMAQVLVEATSILVDLLPTLRHDMNCEKVLQMCIDVNTKENDGDRVLQHALATLFNDGLDPILIIKWKDVYEALETATDRCEDVANIVEGIAIKNA